MRTHGSAPIRGLASTVLLGPCWYLAPPVRTSLDLPTGLSADIIFRNNDNPVGGPHEYDETRQTVVMIEPGLSFTFPKQPVLGGVGGNPWIFAGFTDGNGTSLGENALLGRCVQLSKALSD